MKFAPRIIASAVLMAAGCAQAASVTATNGGAPVTLGGQPVSLTAGSGTLAFSDGGNYDPADPAASLGGALAALSVANIKISDGSIGIPPMPATTVTTEYNSDFLVSASATSTIGSVRIDNSTGNLEALNTQGGIRLTGTRLNGVLTGGTALMSNLRYDLTQKAVVADLSGTKNAFGTNAAVNFNLPGTTLWNIGTVTGPTQIPTEFLKSPNLIPSMMAAGFTYEGPLSGPQHFAGTVVLSDLTLTTAGLNFLRNSLGLLNVMGNALSAVNAEPGGWGTMTATVEFAVGVPEPSTYAMGALGLALVGLSARRRQRHAS